MDNREQIYNKFINKWPPARLEKLSIDEYVLSGENYKETFSYWVDG